MDLNSSRPGSTGCANGFCGKDHKDSKFDKIQTYFSKLLNRENLGHKCFKDLCASQKKLSRYVESFKARAKKIKLPEEVLKKINSLNKEKTVKEKCINAYRFRLAYLPTQEQIANFEKKARKEWFPRLKKQFLKKYLSREMTQEISKSFKELSFYVYDPEYSLGNREYLINKLKNEKINCNLKDLEFSPEIGGVYDNAKKTHKGRFIRRIDRFTKP